MRAVHMQQSDVLRHHAAAPLVIEARRAGLEFGPRYLQCAMTRAGDHHLRLGEHDRQRRPARVDAHIGKTSRVVTGDPQVAHHLEDLAATDRVAVDQGDHGDGQGSDLALEVQDVEPGQTVRADIPAALLVALVAARAEGLVAGAGQQDAADRGVIADPPEGIDQFLDRLGAEGVVDLRPIDHDAGDTSAGMLIADVLVLCDAGPGHGGGHAAASSCRNWSVSERNVAGDSRCGA